MRPVNQRFDRFTMGYDLSSNVGATLPAVKVTSEDLQRGVKEGGGKFDLPLNFGEAEVLRDWLDDYLEAGGR